jgi:hypothetical protein
VSPSTQPPNEFSISQGNVFAAGNETLDEVSQTIVSALASSSSSRQSMGIDLLEQFFSDDPSYLFLIFEEMHSTTQELHLNQDTEKQVLHPLHRNHLKGYHIMSLNPNGNQYLVRKAGVHVHYGVWRPQLCIILEALELLGLLGCIIMPYIGTKSHNTEFAIVRNGNDATMADPGFQAFDFDYIHSRMSNLVQGTQAHFAESYGYSTLSFESTPEKSSGHYRPLLKANTASWECE